MRRSSRCDLLLRSDSGSIAIWLMNGTTVTNPNSAGVATLPMWNIPDSEDYNAGGAGDILLRDGSGNIGKRRLSSGAFRDRQMSVDAECLLLNEGLDWRFSLNNYPQFFLVRVLAGLARQHAQEVKHRPLPNNAFHTEIIGQKSQTVCRALRLAAEWVKKPDDV